MIDARWTPLENDDRCTPLSRPSPTRGEEFTGAGPPHQPNSATRPAKPLLVMRDIEKRFQGVHALAKASLEVEPGEIMALVGQNGAGKSTLIKVLTGAHGRDGGSIDFDGKPVAFGSPQEAQRGGVSTIYQEINLVPFRSVTENIFLGREHRRFGLLNWPRMNAEAAELLRRFAVEIDVRRPLMEFSTAIQQMVAIARAVSFKAQLVIMDEPTSSLDDREVGVLFDVMRRLRAEGVAGDLSCRTGSTNCDRGLRLR